MADEFTIEEMEIKKGTYYAQGPTCTHATRIHRGPMRGEDNIDSWAATVEKHADKYVIDVWARNEYGVPDWKIVARMPLNTPMEDMLTMAFNFLRMGMDTGVT